MKKNAITKLVIICVFIISCSSKVQASDLKNKSILERVPNLNESKLSNQKELKKEEKINYNKESKHINQEVRKWLFENGKWYYINEYGEKVKNSTYEIDGKTYIFDYNGIMVEDSGFIHLGDRNSFYGLAAYYGNGDGTVKTNEWLYIHDSWFYFGSNGKAYENRTYEIDGKMYLFNYDSTMYKMHGRIGWIYVYGNDYYGNGDGTVKTSQWIYDDEHWYYVDEMGKKIKDSIYNINGSTYIFDIYGRMIEQSGWFKIEDKYTFNGAYYEDVYWFYANEDGTVKTNEWIQENGVWYYLYEDGTMLENCTYEENGNIYVFDGSGAMVAKKGWIQIDHWQSGLIWLYGNGDGTVKTNEWIYSKGVWYYIDEYGVMLENCIYEENGNIYIFDGSGAMVAKKGWIQIDHWYYGSLWFYGNGDGTVRTNEWIEENGVWYYLDEDGVWIEGMNR